MPEIEAFRQESETETKRVRVREGERVTCVEKCLQLCGDVVPPTFDLTSVFGLVCPRSIKMKLYFPPFIC